MKIVQVDERLAFYMTLWSIWVGRNSKVWEGKNDDTTSIIQRGYSLLWTGKVHVEFLMAQLTTAQHHHHTEMVETTSWLCQMHVCFGSENKVGIGICLLIDIGNFLGAQTQWVEPILEVAHEALGLLFTFKWVKHLGHRDAIFELDAKLVVDDFKVILC